MFVQHLKKLKRKRLLLLPFLVVLVFSCQKPETYPIIPHIEFKEWYSKKDTLIFGNHAKFIKITLRLTDGDGNIGWDSVMYDPDGVLYETNLFSKVYYKEKGEFLEYKVYFVTNEVVDELEKAGMPDEGVDTLRYMVSDVAKNKIWQGADKFLFIIEQYIGKDMTTAYHDELLQLAEYRKAKYFTMPYVAVSEGQNKTLKADIEVRLEYLRSAQIDEMPYDTIKYEFYLIDRDFNRSNTIKTPEIYFEEETEE